MNPKIALLPLDNRAITYSYTKTLAKLGAVEIFLPSREYLGDLNNSANIPELFKWLEKFSPKADCLILCLDTILYGGLIDSRRHDFDFSQLMVKLNLLKSITKNKLIYAQSSIMRISDNYDNTEEKDYWQDFGREIFTWSHLLYKASLNENSDDEKLNELESKIPQNIKEDYLKTRLTNHMINEQLITEVKSGFINTLIYGIDDSYKPGLNTLETAILNNSINAQKLQNNIFIYPGCDEIANLLLAKAVYETMTDPKPGVTYQFSSNHGLDIIGKYDGGRRFSEILTEQLAVFKQPQKADNKVNIIIHSAKDKQADHIVLDKDKPDNCADTTETVQSTIDCLKKSDLPVVICDLAYANGADPKLIEKLFENKDIFNKVIGYTAWNTAGNSIGSAIAQAILYLNGKIYLKDHELRQRINENLFIRLVDDYAWQSKARQSKTGINLTIGHNDLYKVLETDINKISELLDYRCPNLNLSLPWRRSFEIEVSC